MRVRPVGPRRPVAVVILLALALVGIGRTTGSGWTMVIVSGMAAALGLSAVWPALTLSRVRVAVDAPRDAIAGRPVRLLVDLAGGRTVLKMRAWPSEPSGEDDGDWWWGDAPGRAEVVVGAGPRGVVRHVTAELRAGAPLGLVWWRRFDRLDLVRPMEVGPVLIPTPVPPAAGGGTGDDRPPQVRGGSDSVRSVRDYVAGDPTRLVHWASTARRGHLVVKELEDPEGALLAVVVDLRGSPAEAELTAGRAAGLATSAIRVGRRVVMLTVEDGGPVVAEVASPLEVSRRLARAVAGPPPDGPLPPGASVVRMSGRAS